MARFIMVGGLVLALATAAIAQTIRTTADGDIVVDLPEGKKFITSRIQTVDVVGLHDKMAMLETESPKMLTTAESAKAANDAALNASARVLEITRNMTLAMEEYRAAFRSALAKGVQDLKADIYKLNNQSSKEVQIKLSSFETTLKTQVSKFDSSMGTTLNALLTKTAAGFKCSVQGQAFDFQSGKCTTAKLQALGSTPSSSGCAEAGAISYSSTKGVRLCKGGKHDRILANADVFPAVSHRGWSNNDGRESGYLNNRYLKFTKTMSNTYLKITWYDNMRVHGHNWCAGWWHIYICDQNGNGCEKCTDPGPLIMNKYQHQQHNQWGNDHWAHDIHGICRRKGNNVLNAGTYMLKGYLQHHRCDLYTGHGGQFGSFMVEEVLRG